MGITLAVRWTVAKTNGYGYNSVVECLTSGAFLSKALGSIPSMPHVRTHIHKGVIAPFKLKAIWIRYPIQDRHIQAILCFYYLLIILSLKTQEMKGRSSE